MADAEHIDDVARRAIDKSTLRASVLLDRSFIVRWAQVSIEALLGYSVESMVGRSALDFIHPDDLGPVAEILVFEQDIDVSIRSSVIFRSVRMVRVLRADGVWRTYEVSLSNFFDDPDIGMLLIDMQAQSQLHLVDRAIELTRIGADLADILEPILGQLTAADPGQVAAAIFDAEGELLAATLSAPAPYGQGVLESYRNTWEIELTEAASDEPLGRLQAWCQLPTPHPLDREASARIAVHAAVVIGRHRALEDLERAALRDPLTGIANRRALESDLRGRRASGEEILVAYIDLDGFKAVNDQLGHEAGDLVLVTVADRLRQSIRHRDVVARMGGDEFVLLLGAPAPPRDALRTRLRALIEQPMLVAGRTVTIGASIGFSNGPADSQHLLEHADREMLVHKHAR